MTLLTTQPWLIFALVVGGVAAGELRRGPLRSFAFDIGWTAACLLGLSIWFDALAKTAGG